MDNQKDLERLRAAFQSVEGSHLDRDACPESIAIWDAQKGLLDSEQTHAIVAHTSMCGECAEAWRMALELEAPAEATHSASDGAKVIRLKWVTPAAAFAVAALLLLALAVQFKRPQSAISPDIPFRDSTEEMAIHSLVNTTALLPRDDFMLKWEHAFGEQATFDIQVQTEDLQSVVLATRLNQPEYNIPASKLASFPSGTKLLWQVIVRVDGEQVKWSPTFVNVVE